MTIPYSTDDIIAASPQAMNAIKDAIRDYHKYTCIRWKLAIKSGNGNMVAHLLPLNHNRGPCICTFYISINVVNIIILNIQRCSMSCYVIYITANV